MKAFRLFDDSETSKHSLTHLMRFALGERMTDEALHDMNDAADRDGVGEVSQEEFLCIVKTTKVF